MKPRTKELLLEASKCFIYGYSPFCGSWLSEHEVTLDECIDLSEMIGTVLLGFVEVDFATQRRVIIAGSVNPLVERTVRK